MKSSTAWPLVLLWGALSAAFPTPGLSEIRLPQADGGELQLNHPARRLVTLAPHLAELVFDAGAGDQLLAVAEYSDHPPAAAALPRIGDAFRFDLERIVTLRPDLVIAWASGNPDAALTRLEHLGLRVWRTEIRRPEDIPRLLEWIAAAAGARPPPAVDRARAQLQRLRERYAGASEVSYFYQVAEKPLFTLNGEHLVSQGLALCGGRNIFAAQPVLAPQVSHESVLLADPDVLIAPTIDGQPDPLAHWRSWTRMRAVRSNAFIRLSADRISRATLRTLDSFEAACGQIEAHRGLPREDHES